MKNISEYIKLVPDNLVNLMKGFQNEFRLSILKNIYEEDKVSISYLKKMTKKESGYISSQLHKLEILGLVQNFIQKTKDQKDYSFYEFSNLGKLFYEKTILFFEEYGLNKEDDFKFVSSIFNSISNKFRFSLLNFLIESSESYSFSDLIELSGKNKSSLAFHLHKLETSNLIQNYLQKTEDTQDFSYYKITNLGTEFINIILRLFKLKSDKISISKSEKQENIGSSIKFQSHFSSWALPNEKIIGWLKIESSIAKTIRIEISKYLEFVSIYNIDYDIENIREKRILDLTFDNQSGRIYIGFELITKKPEENNVINNQLIEINVFDSENNEIASERHFIELIKPIVDIDVIKKPIDKNSGYFLVNLSYSRGFDFKISKIDFIIKDSKGKILNIKRKVMKPEEIPDDIPPECDIENFLGNIEIHGRGPFKINFFIKYQDRAENEYISHSKTLEVNDKELIGSNLINLKYNFNETGIKA